jgi:hypothetical protein
MSAFGGKADPPTSRNVQRYTYFTGLQYCVSRDAEPGFSVTMHRAAQMQPTSSGPPEPQHDEPTARVPFC